METSKIVVAVAVAVLVLAYVGIKLLMDRKKPRTSRGKGHENAADYNNSATDILDT